MSWSIKGALSSIYNEIREGLKSVWYQPPVIKSGNTNYELVNAYTVREYESGSGKLFGPASQGKTYNLSDGTVTDCALEVVAGGMGAAQTFWEARGAARPTGETDTSSEVLKSLGTQIAKSIMDDVQSGKVVPEVQIDIAAQFLSAYDPSFVKGATYKPK